jgi:hypothetical protein
MLGRLQQRAVGRGHVHPHQHRLTGLVNLIVSSHANTQERFGVVECLCLVHGPLQEIGEAAQTGIAVIEHRLQQLHHPPQRAMADQGQAQGQLFQPVPGYGQPEQDLVLVRFGGLKGLIEGRRGLLHLLVHELAADTVSLGQTGERLVPTQGLHKQVFSLPGAHLSGHA